MRPYAIGVPALIVCTVTLIPQRCWTCALNAVIAASLMRFGIVASSTSSRSVGAPACGNTGVVAAAASAIASTIERSIMRASWPGRPPLPSIDVQRERGTVPDVFESYVPIHDSDLAVMAGDDEVGGREKPFDRPCGLNGVHGGAREDLLRDELAHALRGIGHDGNA